MTLLYWKLKYQFSSSFSRFFSNGLIRVCGRFYAGKPRLADTSLLGAALALEDGEEGRDAVVQPRAALGQALVEHARPSEPVGVQIEFLSLAAAYRTIWASPMVSLGPRMAVQR